MLILISATLGQSNVEENIDLLGMAPEGEDPVIKMKQYSSDFNAGQIGMILIHANVTGDTNDQDTGNDDPAENLKRIDQLESKLNTVEKYFSSFNRVFDEINGYCSDCFGCATLRVRQRHSITRRHQGNS